jgi:ribosome recycling factor
MGPCMSEASRNKILAPAQVHAEEARSTVRNVRHTRPAKILFGYLFYFQ